MKRTRRSVLAAIAASVPTTAWAMRRSKVPFGVPVPPPTIVSITPTAGGFTQGDPSGTVIGAVNVLLSPAVPTFATLGGTITLTGADAASLQLSSSSLPSNLETNGALSAGVYNANYVPHLTGAIGDGVPFPFVVTGSTGVQISTMTMVNTSASAQVGGFVTPMFGWVFKKGEIPSGTAPVFKAATAPQPYSWGCQSYWSDGSLKFASFMMLYTGATIAGNGSVAIGVWNGGTAPTASVRTLTEVYTEALVANVTGYGASLGLAGVLGGWLRSDSNNVEQLVYLDGDAGKVWRVLTHMSPTIGGTPHGQMECWHYVAALTNGTGDLGGFRYLPCIAQPWYNVDSPAKAIRSFTTVNWQHGAGPTTVPLALGATAIDFTRTSSSAITTRVAGVATASDYYTGSDDGLYNVPCYLTSTGTLPAGFALDTIYYVRGVRNSTSAGLYLSAASTSPRPTTDAGTGTHTIHPIATLQHFGRLFMPTVDAKWNFFQGAGSFTAEPTIRTTIDQNYWNGDATNKLSLLPSFDLALKGIVTDATFTYNWTPYGAGSGTVENSAGGGTAGRSDLGAIPGWQVIDFYQQSANSERLVRINAFPGVGFLHCLRNNTNHNVVNIRGVAHTGLTQFTTIHWYPDTNSSGSAPGFTRPPDLNTTQTFNQGSNAHKANFYYYPYMRTGEPQFLDCMIETSILGVQELLPASRNPTGTNPAPYTGVGSLYGGSGGERQVAWAHRDMQCAAAICPLVMPDVSDLYACLNGISDDSISVMLDLGASTAINGSFAVANKLWQCYSPGTPAAFVNQSFQHQYVQMAVCFAACARENADAITWLQNEVTWHNYIVAQLGYYCTVSYFFRTLENWVDIADGTVPLTSLVYFGASSPWASVWNSASSPNWTFTRVTPANGAVLADGDKFMFNPKFNTLPTNYSVSTVYYAINTSGNSCNLTTVAGNAGSIVVPNGSGNMGSANANYNWYVPITDVPAALGAASAGYSGSGSYFSWKRGTQLWMTAIGVTGLSASITDAGVRSGCTGTNPEFLADPRLAYQDHFGV